GQEAGDLVFKAECQHGQVPGSAHCDGAAGGGQGFSCALQQDLSWRPKRFSVFPGYAPPKIQKNCKHLLKVNGKSMGGLFNLQAWS
ncbi:hypothetical protein J0S82_002670, partial [Galemys pyrenaicus]